MENRVTQDLVMQDLVMLEPKSQSWPLGLLQLLLQFK